MRTSIRTSTAILLAVSVALAAALGHAYSRAPLFWQGYVEEDGIKVQRLHDAQRMVDCYVASPSQLEHSTLNDRLSISCVKIK